MAQHSAVLRRPVAALCSTSKPSSTLIGSSIVAPCLSRAQLRFQSAQKPSRCFHTRLQTPTLCSVTPRSHVLPKRGYHSAFHPAPDPAEEAFTPEQTSILSAATSHIPEHGFSAQSLTLGARDAGYLDVSLQLFPKGGEVELVMFWLKSRRGLLKQRAVSGEIFKRQDAEVDGAASGKDLSREDKVKLLIWERLKMNADIIHHWQDALAIMSLPSNISSSLSELYALSSDILYLANDTSVDASWYAKRVSVATVYASSDVYMTEDQSPGFRETEEFVVRRIDDTRAAVDSLGEAKRFLGFVAGSVAGAGRSWGMKI